MPDTSPHAKPKLMIVSTVPNTITSTLNGQLRWLSDYFDVSIATSPDAERIGIIQEVERITPHQITMARRINPIQDIVSIYKLVKLFREIRPDIVHSYTPKAGMVAAIAGTITGVPTRLHTFTRLLFPTATGVKQRMLIAIDKVICRFVTHIVPEGLGVKQDLENFGVTTKPMRLIGNGNIAGIDVEHFDPDHAETRARSEELKRELAINEAGKVFTFIGRLNRDKGLDELSEAFQAVVERHPDARLLCLGFYDETAPLNPKTHATLSSHPAVELVGFVQDIRPYLALSDGLILPSYREGFPNVLLQASAMAVPVIATDINGCNEIVEHGKTGWLVPARDAGALEQAMDALCAMDAPTLTSMGDTARAHVTERFEKGTFRTHLLAFYREAQASGIRRRSGRIYRGFRLVADRLVALIALIVTSPILLIGAVMVASDKGPILFRQKRLGLHGSEFSVFKLRTMIVDADKYLDEAGMPTRKRTTRFGDFLRKTSIDELPQLINVIKGDMALIGPRPILPRMLPFMTAREKRRFSVLPGVSGLAQIKGRNNQKWSRRFKYDTIYAQRMSLSLDLFILWRTVKMVFKSEDIAGDINRDQVDDVTTRIKPDVNGTV